MTPSLEYFYYIAKYNNLTKAAEVLHVTQQSLSSYLKHLESYYNIPLFNRKPSFTLTPFGQSVYTIACQIKALQDDIITSRDYYALSNHIGVGFSYSHVYRARSLFNIPQFRRENPDFMIKFRHGPESELVSSLIKGELDIFFGTVDLPPVPSNPSKKEDLIRKDILNIEYELIVHPDCLYKYFGEQTDSLRARWKNGIDLHEMKDVPLIMLSERSSDYLYDAVVNHYTPTIISDCDNVHLVMEMVIECYGYAVIPRLSSAPHEEFDEYPLITPESLASGKLYVCSTSYALERPIVKNLWDRFVPLSKN